MDKELFKKTEGLLYRYWAKKQRIERLRSKLATIEKQTYDIRTIMADKDDLIPMIGVIGNYMAVVTSGGGDGSSKVERAYNQYERTMDDLHEELLKLVRDKVKTKMKLMQLESESEGVEFALSMLTDADKKIVEQKYLYRRSNVQVGMALGFDEGTIRYKRRAIVERVARILGLK